MSAVVLPFRKREPVDLRGLTERMLSRGTSTNTWVTYDKAWKKFSAFCAERGENPDKAPSDTLCEFLVSLYTVDGHANRTIRTAFSGLRYRFKQTGHWTADHGAKGAAVLKSISAEMAKGVYSYTKQRVTSPIGYREYMLIEDASLEAAAEASTEWARIDIMRDLALVSIMRDALLRRSEASAVNWEHIDYDGSDGTGILLIPRSKTDPFGDKQPVSFLSEKTMQYLRAIRGDRVTGPVFVSRKHVRMCDRAISERLKRAARRAGLPATTISGHSCRIGMAHDLARINTSMVALQNAGRWKDTSMPVHYTKHIAAKDNAVARFHRKLTQEGMV